MRDAWAGGKLREGEEACGGEGKEGGFGVDESGCQFRQNKVAS